MIKTKDVHNVRVYYDDRYTERWVDAVGEGLVKYVSDAGVPNDANGDIASWVCTQTSDGTGTSTCAPHTTNGKWLLITTAEGEYDGTSMQLDGSQFIFSGNKPLYFGIKCSVSDATQSDFLVGMCEVDTTLTAVDTSHAITVTDDGEYFFKLDGGTTIYVASELDGTVSSAAASTAMDTSYHVYEIYYDSSQVDFYMDDALVATHTSGLAAVAVTPSISFKAGSGAEKTMNVEWCRAFQVTET